ncbi:NYN domain-containing protein [Ruegeria meonggei]|uniref:NYN domain-containing protein n=1 Tax=Ruegeria meonggei TaxID=1446476 RepID=UPI00366D3A5D
MDITINYSIIEILAVRFLSTIFTISICGVVVAVLDASLSDWLLLAVPCAMTSALLLLNSRLQSAEVNKNWIVIDGSNVMHWNDGTPKMETVREVVSTLTNAGLTPGVVFDANAGYKISGRYMHDKALGSLLGLPKDRVMVAPKGMPADPMILQFARDYGAMIVTNDRFRDWVDDYADVLKLKEPVRGGYKNGKLWLSL